ncbi:hypothetical protein SLEP1_g24631 [Rubroshorea leprosula]|uniref:Uncharacterized protein n=1 Tax=Rubroshorea leprosula TaxID=152421 RepID=A0AAV5JGA4_9ROSI|nr:hypothetical protein SLEP1_g24631 [Rubroshorea leprosula]
MISSPVFVGLHSRQLRFWLLEKYWCCCGLELWGRVSCFMRSEVV